MRGVGRFARVVSLAAALAACSPAYNWRTVTNAADGYSIDLPAKPTVDERPVDIAGRPMTMKVQAAHAQGAVFAVGVIVLPGDDAQLRRTVADYVRTSLARNLGVAAEGRAVQVPLAAGGNVEGVALELSGAAGAGHEHKTLRAWIVARGNHVYEATLVAGEQPAQEQVDQFFQSFKLF
ncbi:hypothetical protein D7S89_10795 [Trinickia fusca]|uniref:Lipoprotein n=1 Tax=Trinickia fusca TaxID=2419777 RepID=A0A494XLJ8_9BURK|nr:hypothetical protein D7S89_10795 [Trinickia fusca]